jgi:hypothetical protein
MRGEGWREAVEPQRAQQGMKIFLWSSEKYTARPPGRILGRVLEVIGGSKGGKENIEKE